LFLAVQTLQPPYSTKDIFGITNAHQFDLFALKAFQFQYKNNRIYRQFCDFMNASPGKINAIDRIPFLPIELFKNHRIVTGDLPEQVIFRSSGTTGSIKSEHHVVDLNWYNQSLLEGFKRVFGEPGEYAFVALLPGYIERPDSSLIYMVNQLMQHANNGNNAFYIQPNEEFLTALQHNQQSGLTTVLFGVSFSLLEFANHHPIDLKDVILIETGGMKGMAEEKIKAELHTVLKEKFNLSTVCSEYGMTELLSQAYSLKDQIFELPPWMQLKIRETNDPQSFLEDGKGGGINVIDLANIYSCCFIATQDLGKKISPNTFEVLGRFDNADLRGCNLLFA
jgi:phenylacetate-coenzyme A ligase PaaK-like adenylate-forming protein